MIFLNSHTIPTLSILAQRFSRVVITEYKFWVDLKGLLYFDDPKTYQNPRNQIRDRKFIEKLY